MTASAQSGYTLPVFATAAAIAALRWLRDDLTPLPTVAVNLLEPPETVDIPVEQVARLDATSALAITRSDPGDNLDLTRHTPIWARVAWGSDSQTEPIRILGGEGIGRWGNAKNQPAIYQYARRSLQENLRLWLPEGRTLEVTIILPEGRSLAERTSNAAFGVVDGLSLLGTSGISHALSAPAQLEAFRQDLQQKASHPVGVVFCIGENGLDLARNFGISSDRLVKTANWLGPLLVEASQQRVPALLLFGYHGKLLKLAGGIFHTHHYVADGRQAILTAYCAQSGLPAADLDVVFHSPTAEAVLAHLRQLDATTGSDWVPQVYGAIAQEIDQRAQAYIQSHSQQLVRVGCLLFDRDRQIVWTSAIGAELLERFRTASSPSSPSDDPA